MGAVARIEHGAEIDLHTDDHKEDRHNEVGGVPHRLFYPVLQLGAGQGKAERVRADDHREAEVDLGYAGCQEREGQRQRDQCAARAELEDAAGDAPGKEAADHRKAKPEADGLGRDDKNIARRNAAGVRNTDNDRQHQNSEDVVHYGPGEHGNSLGRVQFPDVRENAGGYPHGRGGHDGADEERGDQFVDAGEAGETEDHRAGHTQDERQYDAAGGDGGRRPYIPDELLSVRLKARLEQQHHSGKLSQEEQ